MKQYEGETVKDMLGILTELILSIKQQRREVGETFLNQRKRKD